MFVGHGLLAFAVAAAVLRHSGRRPRQALLIGLVAGLFATVPDVDIAYALLGLLDGVSGPFDAANHFWSTGNEVHRALTHSLLVGLIASVAAWLWSRRGTDAATAAWQSTLPAGLLLAGLVSSGLFLDGLRAGAILLLFAVGVLAVTTFAVRRDVSPSMVATAALIGLLSHPFGDLFTGSPPALLYPLDVAVIADRVTIHPDPTLHLLGAFGLELFTAWLALSVYAGIRGIRIREHVDSRAVLGVGYAVAALLITPPTLDMSYQFVVSILAVGSIGPVGFAPATQRTVLGRAAIRLHRPRVVESRNAVATALVAVTLAGIAYTFAYVGLGG
jgi:membrane-bound metal-dependent hydrolase YbcI (DUF457 family)